MPDARLEVTDALGARSVTIDKAEYRIGRRDTNDLRLAGSEVSRDHAEIVFRNGEFLLRDRGSRYGSFVNGEAVSEKSLQHGDRIRLGRGGGAELTFLAGEIAVTTEPSTATAIGDLRHVAALLEGLRALGSGRVLDDVLALVLDSALDVSAAERGFIMLAGTEGKLDFKLARSRGRVTLGGKQFETSRKIPEEVFASGTPRIVADLLDADLVGNHMGTVALGIRNVLCVPLRLVRYLDRGEAAGEEQRIGVLYLDSREKGALLANSTRTALETLATEAAVAIENARLYRETVEKARLEQEMRIAAEIQLALLPKQQHTGKRFTVCATTIPSRSIGGDFFDYVGLGGDRFHFVLGDVTGKGPPAALLSAMVLGIFAAQDGGTSQPADTVSRVNDSLCRRAIESKFVTAVYGHLGEDGTLVYANAGHNPPLVVGTGGVRRLEAGGTPLGMFEGMPYQQETLTLVPGDVLVVFSDGVSEALSKADEEYGEQRITDIVSKHVGAADPRTVLDALIRDVKTFAEGAPQNDDITALVLSFHG